ncbi:MAG: NUDIX hydrolase [Planctomycetaceae bacterium]|nr:MAG: NUDIX hydrolase [Planctomycetaceae bacterium]
MTQARPAPELPDTEVLLETQHLRLVRRGTWQYVERRNVHGVVVVIPMTRHDELVLVEQYRIPVAAHVIELCAGLADIIDGQPEPLETAARRELLEETGYQADRLEHLFAGPPSPGISNEILTFYYAPDVERVAAGGGTDADEDIHVHTVPLASIENWLQQQTVLGKEIDPRVYVAVYVARHRKTNRVP